MIRDAFKIVLRRLDSIVEQILKENYRLLSHSYVNYQFFYVLILVPQNSEAPFL